MSTVCITCQCQAPSWATEKSYQCMECRSAAIMNRFAKKNSRQREYDGCGGDYYRTWEYGHGR
jgi:hypothetical protein